MSSWRGDRGRVHAGECGVYGARKMWLRLRSQGHDVARCTAGRLSGQMGVTGAAAPGHGDHPAGPGRGPAS